MASTSEPPSQFMSLPRELRDKIYTHVFSFPEQKTSSCSNTDNKTYQILRSKDETHPLTITLPPISFPWLNLLRTNGILADEMRNLYNLPSLHTSPASQTWHATITLNNSILTLTWDSLPCPSSQVQHLLIDLRITLSTSNFGHWDTQQETIFSSLFQLLNQILHRGPNITSPTILATPISFQTMTLNLSFPDEDKPKILRPSGPESFYIVEYGKTRLVGKFIEMLVLGCGNGGFEGRVGHVSVVGPCKAGGLGQRTEINVTRKGERREREGKMGELERKWRDGGFCWGVNVRDSCAVVS